MQEVASGELVVSALKLFPNSFSLGHGPSVRAWFGACTLLVIFRATVPGGFQM